MATSYEEFDVKFASFGTRNFEGTPLDGHCRYRFLSYPTQDIWNEHHNSEPLNFAMVVAMIFLFASIMFVLYDCLVTRRQRIITNRALQTNAIVASLFPASVRKRMYAGKPGRASLVTSTPKRKLTSYLNKNGNDFENPSRSLAIDPTPIADLFPSCTVLFADIAG